MNGGWKMERTNGLTRILKLVVIILSLLFLTSCKKDVTEQAGTTIEIDGQSGVLTFNQETRSAGTISMENGEYKFRYDKNGDIVITYPNGHVYRQTNINGALMVSGGSDSNAIKEQGYIDGFSLVWGIERAMDARNSHGRGSASPFLAFVLIIIGAWYAFVPRSAWWLARGWWYKNAEPSNLAIGFYRIGGCLLILIGIICAIAAI